MILLLLFSGNFRKCLQKLDCILNTLVVGFDSTDTVPQNSVATVADVEKLETEENKEEEMEESSDLQKTTLTIDNSLCDSARRQLTRDVIEWTKLVQHNATVQKLIKQALCYIQKRIQEISNTEERKVPYLDQAWAEFKVRVANLYHSRKGFRVFARPAI